MELKAGDFSGLLGIPGNELPAACQALLSESRFEYEMPDPQTRDSIILEVLKHIDSDRATKVGEHRAEIWESCWADNLQRFIGANHNPERLLPSFYRAGRPVRLRQQYVFPKSERFEADFLQVCRAFLFDRFFREVGAVYEFGCGSGFNLAALASQLPGKRLFGLDWSQSAVDTVNLLKGNLGIDITGRRFDFFAPDATLRLERSSGVLTMCALEQVGTRHRTFVDFILRQRPTICVHMEPLVDLYDENNLIDYLAVRYHRKREYLTGFLAHLQELSAAGMIEILDTRRTYFGSLYHEGYSFVAWRPVDSARTQ